MAVARITKRAVDEMRPGKRDRYLWDDRLKGFGAKITPKGTVSYVLQYRPDGARRNARRMTIGRHGVFTPTQARDKAEGLLRGLRLDAKDPIDERGTAKRLATDLAYLKYAELFLEKRGGATKWAPQTAADYRRHLLAEGGVFFEAFRHKSLPEIKRADIAAAFDRVADDKPASARAHWATLRRFLNWAVERGDIDRSPADGFKGPKPVAARERVLSDAELAAAWLATDELDYPFRQHFRLLIATGQRLNEVAKLDWSELDRGDREWRVPSEKAKNDQSHIVALNSLAIETLDSIVGDKWPRRGLVFSTTNETPISGFSRPKRRLDDEIAKVLRKDDDAFELEPWRTHDLRRTLATGMQRLDVRFEVTEAILNHVSGARGGVAGVYQRHDWRQEKHEAMARWDRFLRALFEKV